MRRSMTNFFTGLREAWVLAKPYFSSEERWAARGLLVAIIALNLLMVGMNLILNFWNRDFFNAIQAYDVKTSINLLFLYILPPGSLPMPGFVEIVTIYVLVAVYSFYLNQMLQIRWRQWMTRQYVQNWLADRAYYNISLSNLTGTGMDNPDQRISEDLRDFTTNTLSLGLDFISNLVTLFSFIFILYAISGSIKLFGINIPGYMLWVALIYSVVGTFLTHIIGRKLIPLSFNQQKVEADFRYNLIRVRENPEAIALYHGEADEQISLGERFESVRSNFWAIMRRTKALNFFTVSFNQLAGIFPLIVALPRFFAHKIGLGGLTQIQDAFGQVQGALSWFITSYPNLVTYRATVSRLNGFTEAVTAARAASLSGPQLTHSGSALSFENLTLSLPDGRKLINNASLTLPPGLPIILTGPSGAGKSTLFRAIAGIWPFGEGTVTRPTGSALFLPQKPYFPLGSLKRTVVYPALEADISDDTVREALTAVDLAPLTGRLHEIENWGQILSGGEQQRLAIARALIVKPDWLFLDEATSALDSQLSARVEATLRKLLPKTTIVAISHRENEAVGSRHLTLTPSKESVVLAI
jgi:vitamin B12/bleomycin/antimicrobial peptide transport system ATP-binding/permease protein